MVYSLHDVLIELHRSHFKRNDGINKVRTSLSGFFNF